MVDTAAQQLGEEALAALGVRCLTLSLSGMNLLLPNTLVAEVTQISSVTAAAHAPDWLAGFVSWRGRSVPLVRFEQLLGVAAPRRHEERRMVILNTLNGNPRLPFMAVEIQGMPHLSLLKHGMLKYDEGNTDRAPVVLAALQLDGESVLVPNLDAMERLLENLGLSA
ncbi:MAG: chemotaxis protein CheW [Gammaproteobacteria bacterium]|nr:chemotaxis protein CheW [Gammaproteobacteria bacterium]